MAIEVPQGLVDIASGKEITAARLNNISDAIAAKTAALGAEDFKKYLHLRGDVVLQGAGGAPLLLTDTVGNVVTGVRNVKSYMYGANASNFPTALQAAVDATWLDYATAYSGTRAIRGNVTWIPPGVYSWHNSAASVALAPNMVLEGAGIGHTVIVGSTTALNWLVIGNRAWNWSTFNTGSSGARGRLTVRGITFDARQSQGNTTGSYPIRFVLPVESGLLSRPEVIIDNCMFIGCDIAAVLSGGNVIIRNSYFVDCHYGVYAYQGTADAPRLLVHRCSFASVGTLPKERTTSFIYTEDPTGFVGAQIVDCTFSGRMADNNGQAVQILNGGTICDGNFFDRIGGVGGYGIRVSASTSGFGGIWSIITNNGVVADDPASSYNMASAIRVDHTGQCIIAGNAVRGDTPSKVKWAYGIDVNDPTGSCLGANRIIGNNVGVGVVTPTRLLEQTKNPYNFRDDAHKPDIHRYGHGRSYIAMCDLALLTAGPESIPTAASPWGQGFIQGPGRIPRSAWIFNEATANKAALGAKMWKPIAHGLNGECRQVETFRGALYVGGVFAQAGQFHGGTWTGSYFQGPVMRIAKLAGSYWEQVAQGFDGYPIAFLKTADRLYIGGSFRQDAARSTNVEYWGMTYLDDGKTFYQIGGPTAPADSRIEALIEHGQHIVAGGKMTTIKRNDTGSTISAYGIGAWDPVTNLWVQTLAGGDYYGCRLARDGGDAVIACMERMGNAVLIGGDFTRVDGYDGTSLQANLNARHLAVLRGSAANATEFQPLNDDPTSILAFGVDGPVTCMKSFRGFTLIGGLFRASETFHKSGAINVTQTPMSRIAVLTHEGEVIDGAASPRLIAVAPALDSEPYFMLPISSDETGSMFGARVLVGGRGFLKLLILPDTLPAWGPNDRRVFNVTWIDIPIPANFYADAADNRTEPPIFLGAKLVGDKVILVGGFTEGRGSVEPVSYGIKTNMEG